MVSILVASDEATFGSVIPYMERTSAFKRGSKNSFFYSSEPYKCNVSIFPVSGAEQLNTIGAKNDLPYYFDCLCIFFIINCYFLYFLY